ncbi:MAG: hypothetical protein ACOVRN_05320 [Flavobacterium sp.]
MANLDPENLVQRERSKAVLNPVRNPNTIGKIAETIGTGESAKNSIVYLVIKWSFYSGVFITSLVVINSWLFNENEKTPDLISDIETTWSIVIPIITLALGYAFGKSGK